LDGNIILRKKKLINLLVILFVFSFFTGCINNENSMDGRVKILDRNLFFDSIMQAVDSSYDGETLIVGAGSYNEFVNIYRSIKLLADDKENTIIDATGNGDGINIVADNVEINGFIIKNAGDRGYPSYDSGIDVKSNNNTIINNRIFNNKNFGIYLYKSSNNTIENNFISNNTMGIYVDGSYAYMIFDNNISKNHISENLEKGIYLSYCFNSSIVNNNISNNDYGFHMQHCDDNFVSDNLFYNNIKGLFFCCGTEDNYVFRNIFINNSEYNAMSNTKNFFDYNGFGNFWDDYKGSDDDFDGIGDEPYVLTHHQSIDVNNSDNYPYINKNLLK